MKALSWASAVVIVVIVLCGCASNGISVSETTPDGGTLHVRQHTFSSMFAKTQEGAGNFIYTGESPDGSRFDMKAGAAVVGQDGGDPTALILGVMQAIMPTIQAAVERSPEPQPAPTTVLVDPWK